MALRVTFTLDEDAYAFLKAVGGENQSAFVNHLLKEEKRRLLAAAILKANQEEASDHQYQEELFDWNETS